MQGQCGFESHDSLWELEPRKSKKPSREQIERIPRERLHLDEATDRTVTFLAQGGFNKLYAIDATARRWVMRVALPVDPHRKTASEVSTMCFVRRDTSMPVPSVLSRDASNDNSFPFEWILMEYVSGSGLKRVWRTLIRSQKQHLAEKLAQYQSELLRNANRFKAIVNLFQSRQGLYEIRSTVSMTFFWARHRARDLNRGPFQNSYKSLLTRLRLL